MSFLDPITRKRFARFREFRRAWWSFWILTIAYLLSLGSEFICNSRPLYVKLDDRTFLPALFDYAENDFLTNGVNTRPDYKAIAKLRPDAKVLFPPVPYGPLETLKAETIQLPETVTVTIVPDAHVATIDLRPDFTIARAVSAGFFFATNDEAVSGLDFAVVLPPSASVKKAFTDRFANEAASAFTETVRGSAGRKVEVSMPDFAPRAQAPKTLRVTLREPLGSGAGVQYTFLKSTRPKNFPYGTNVLAAVAQRFDGEVAPIALEIDGARYRASFSKEDVRFPLKPVPGHPLGLDRAGRDVLSRLLYGLRTSVSFGLVLVVSSMLIGTFIGAWQGYHGGWRDIVGQRLTEIWEALPFLYIVMLMGSVFGRSFMLLIVCYGLFMWIGISYYMRAEFLRLRRQSFVEAARCMGLSKMKIIVRHILPNGLVPIITFFPFSLVGAIGSLAALDYLGFGLPPPTPSWGEMLSQAQDHPWAWWLVLYPALALFFVMLLCVFIGEGVRAAFDPRRFSRLE